MPDILLCSDEIFFNITINARWKERIRLFSAIKQFHANYKPRDQSTAITVLSKTNYPQLSKAKIFA